VHKHTSLSHKKEDLLPVNFWRCAIKLAIFLISRLKGVLRSINGLYISNSQKHTHFRVDF